MSQFLVLLIDASNQSVSLEKLDHSLRADYLVCFLNRPIQSACLDWFLMSHFYFLPRVCPGQKITLKIRSKHPTPASPVPPSFELIAIVPQPYTPVCLSQATEQLEQLLHDFFIFHIVPQAISLWLSPPCFLPLAEPEVIKASLTIQVSFLAHVEVGYQLPQKERLFATPG